VAAKRDIARLLAGGLSGTEVGRLVISHILELEGGGEGFLSEKDIAQIRASLRSGDGTDYNRIIDLYRSVREMVIEAQITSLHCVAALRELEAELERYAISAEVRRLAAHLPLLTSEEAYTTMRQRQRQRLGARMYSLADVIEERAIEGLGGHERAEEVSVQDHEVARATAEAEIATLIENGVLAPVRLGHKASMSTVKRAQQLQSVHDDDLLPDPDESEEVILELAANRAAWQERLAASLEQGDLTGGCEIAEWFGEVEAGDEERLLHHYLSGEQLAEAGLPEWQRWLAEFKPWEEGTEGDGVAIVTAPSFGDFDSDGLYHSFCLTRLADVAEVRRREELYAQTYGRPFAALLGDMLGFARWRASELLAHQQVVAEAGAAARVPFLVESDTTTNTLPPFPYLDWRRDMLADVKTAAASYNELAARVRRWRGELRGPQLPAFELAELEPDADTLALLRQRLALGIGRGGLEADWWEAVGRG